MPALKTKPKRRSSRTNRALEAPRDGSQEESLSLEKQLPSETSWQRECVNLLVESVKARRRGRENYFVGGNSHIYYSLKQIQNREFFGLDFFYVHGQPQVENLKFWAVWEQGGRYPDVIIDVLSENMAMSDQTKKTEIYRTVFHTAEYFVYDPCQQKLEGFRLLGHKYAPMKPDPHGHLWSEELKLSLGKWEGEYHGEPAVWLRFFDRAGRVVPTVKPAKKPVA